MVSDLAAETAIKLGGEEYALSYKIDGLRLVEKITGKPVLKFLNDVRADPLSVGQTQAFDLLQAGLVHLRVSQGLNADAKWLEKRYETSNYLAYLRAIMAALGLSNFGAESLRGEIAARDPDADEEPPAPLASSPGATG